MKGVVLEHIKEFKYYTFMDQIFPLLGDVVSHYDWLITSVETNRDTSVFQEQNDEDHYLLDGGFLQKHLEAERIQFIWGVFSAIPKDAGKTKEKLLAMCVPWADGYTGFWKNPLTIQHPLADCEIVAWDSSLTLLIAKDHISLDKALALDGAKDLYEYNRDVQ